MDQILVAVDGTSVCDAALAHAVALARQSRAALTGIFIIDTQWANFIGNDWQSSRNARQGFLDYMREEQEQQAEAAREQFTKAAADLRGASFAVLAGDPAEVLLETANGQPGRLLVLGRRAFQASGRPSMKRLAHQVASCAKGPITLFP